jgi:hypothetical protein
VNEKAFRLDFFIAIAALLVSVLTSATLLYQTRIIGQQYAATIWPYLNTDTTAGPNGLEIAVVNDGLGPALIESAQLSIDGRPVPSWGVYFARLSTDPVVHAFMANLRALSQAGKLPPDAHTSTGSLVPGDSIRAGDKMTLLRMQDLPNVPLAAIQHHTLAIDVCYCSLNGSCWTLHAESGSEAPDRPKPASKCTTSASISAKFATSPSVLLRKK